MFAINFRRVYYLCDKIIIRNVRGGRKSNIGLNPGLDRRLQAFQEEGLKVVDNDAEEFIEQSDSTFYTVGQEYSEHLKETTMNKRDLRHHIVKEKYFKENMPNLLTWSEKEQIRHLISEHPDEWTPEKIAESFPVTVHVVKKLIKFPWKPASEQRIERHDASAMRNWKELKDGTLNIPKSLREHFLKFSERTIPPLNRKSIKDDLTREEKLGEFARIVQKCAKESESKTEQKQWVEDNQSNFNKENKVNVEKDSQRTTLEELTTRIKKRIESGADVNLPDKIILDTVTETSTIVDKGNFNEIELFNDKSHKEERNELAEYKESDTDVLKSDNYPERIRIPRKAYKKGATYKINDCFYDDDGRFLYRVLGMTKN